MAIVEVNKEDVVILEGQSKRIIFTIPLKYLGLTTVKGGVIHSFWVLHLAQYNGINLDTLYTLAKQIHQRHPQSNINWELIFFAFEKLDYTMKAQTLKAGLTGSASGISRSVDLARQDEGDEINARLFQLTAENLARYQLLS